MKLYFDKYLIRCWNVGKIYLSFKDWRIDEREDDCNIFYIMILIFDKKI